MVFECNLGITCTSEFFKDLKIARVLFEVFEKLRSAYLSKFHEKPWYYYLLIIYIKIFDTIVVYSEPSTGKVFLALLQGAIIRVPTYRRYAKFMVWYFFVFKQVPRRYTEICYSRTYIFLLAITSKTCQSIQNREEL
jgi:hypothetical protein